MSITIYGKQIVRYPLDTNETFQRRIAIQFDTLPQFIEMDPIKILRYDIELHRRRHDVLDVKQFLATGIQQRYDWIPLSSLLLYWYGTLRLTPEFFAKKPLDACIIEISTAIEEYGFKDQLNVRQEGGSFVVDSSDPALSLGNIKERIQLLVSADKALEGVFTEMGNLVPLYKNPQFVVEEEMISWKTDVVSSLESIFAAMTATREIPLLAFRGVYKVFSEVLVPLQWEGSQSDYIFVWVDHREKVDEDCSLNPSNYWPIALSFRDENEKLASTLYLRSHINYDTLKLREQRKIDEFKTRIFQRIQRLIALPAPILTSDFIVGKTIIPTKTPINVILLSDMMMNDPLFSHFMAVSESQQASKTRDGLFLQYFFKNQTGGCTIIPKLVKRGDPDLTHLPPSEENSSFIRFRIGKIKDKALAELLVDTVSRLFTRYFEREQQVRTIYKGYGILVDERVRPVLQVGNKQVMLKDEVPDVFVAQYSRKCGRQRQPRVVRDEDLSGYQPYQYKTFPYTPEEGQQNQYLCDHPENGFNYMGVIANQNENNEKYPFVPCCFKEDQDVRNGGWKNYMKYMETGGLKPKRVEDPQHRFKTHKFSSTNNLSEIPDDYLRHLLQTIDKEASPTRTYSRLGGQSELSFLDAVLKAVRKEYNIMTEIGSILASPESSVLVSQEFPGMTSDAIHRQLQTIVANLEYFDPRRWIRLLEVRYSCQILVFTKPSRRDDITVSLPFNEMGHLFYDNPSSTVILIYEHNGAETDDDPYPRCELIVAEDTTVRFVDRENRYFDRRSINLPAFLDSIHRQYSYDLERSSLSPFRRCVLPGSFGSPHYPSFAASSKTVTAQYIDRCGKARCLLINGLYVYTTPLPPLVVTVFTDAQLTEAASTRYGVKDIEGLMQRHPLLVPYSSHRRGRTSEITFQYHSHLFSVKVSADIPAFSGVLVDSAERYPTASTNRIEHHRKMERMAKLTIEYFIYFYSMMKVSLSDFIVKHIRVVAKHTYQLPSSPDLSVAVLTQHGFVNNGQFIVDSSETRRGLCCALHARLVNNRDEVAEYAKKGSSNHFYDRIDDFNLNDPLTIVTNRLSIMKPIDRSIYTFIRPSPQFFFQHPTVEDNVISLVIASDQETIREKYKEAGKRCLEWNRTRDVTEFLFTQEEKQEEIVSTVYRYHSADDIDEVSVGEGKKNSAMIVSRQSDVVSVASVHPLR